MDATPARSLSAIVSKDKLFAKLNSKKRLPCLGFRRAHTDFPGRWRSSNLEAGREGDLLPRTRQEVNDTTFDPVKKTAGMPRVLFQTHIVGATFVLFQYDVTPDGRFLVNTLKPDSPLTLINNWPTMIGK